MNSMIFNTDEQIKEFDRIMFANKSEEHHDMVNIISLYLSELLNNTVNGVNAYKMINALDCSSKRSLAIELATRYDKLKVDILQIVENNIAIAKYKASNDSIYDQYNGMKSDDDYLHALSINRNEAIRKAESEIGKIPRY